MIRINPIFKASSYEGVRTFKTAVDKFPAQVFLPNRPQADLARAIGNYVPQKRVFLVTSGNGTGKTTGALNILLNIIYPGLNIYKYAKDIQTGEEFPGFFNYPLYQKFPKDWPKSIWYVSNKEGLKSIDKKFKTWLPRDWPAKYFKYDSQKLNYVKFPDSEWDMSFKTIEQDPITFETADISIIVFDEPPPYRLFAAAVWRLRGGGIIIIPATPLFTAAWFVDEIIDKIKLEGEDSNKHHQTVDVWTNCIETAGEWDLGPFGIQKKGNLWKSNIEFQLSLCDPDEIEARRDGIFKYLTGLVFKLYDPIIWLKTPLLPAGNPIYCAYRMLIDPHERRPPAIYWERIERNGQRYIMRHWPSKKDPEYHGLPFHRIKDAGQYTINDFVRVIKQIESEELHIPDRKRIRRIMDPNFGNKRDQDTGLTTAQMYVRAARELLKETWHFHTSAVDDLYYGHEAVRKLLKKDSKGLWPLLIGPECDEIDWALRHYSWQDLTPKMEEVKELSKHVKEIGKDFIDLLRYDAMVPFIHDEFPILRDPYDETDYGEVFEDKDDWREKFKPAPERPVGARGA